MSTTAHGGRPSPQASGGGHIYIVDMETRMQYHLTVELAGSSSRGPATAPPLSQHAPTTAEADVHSRRGSHERSPMTRVTGRALRHTIETVLVPLVRRVDGSPPHPHRLSLLPTSHGRPRRAVEDDAVLPDGAIVEVHACTCGCRSADARKAAETATATGATDSAEALQHSPRGQTSEEQHTPGEQPSARRRLSTSSALAAQPPHSRGGGGLRADSNGASQRSSLSAAPTRAAVEGRPAVRRAAPTSTPAQRESSSGGGDGGVREGLGVSSTGRSIPAREAADGESRDTYYYYYRSDRSPSPRREALARAPLRVATTTTPTIATTTAGTAPLTTGAARSCAAPAGTEAPVQPSVPSSRPLTVRAESEEDAASSISFVSVTMPVAGAADHKVNLRAPSPTSLSSPPQGAGESRGTGPPLSTFSRTDHDVVVPDRRPTVRPSDGVVAGAPPSLPRPTAAASLSSSLPLSEGSSPPPPLPAPRTLRPAGVEGHAAEPGEVSERGQGAEACAATASNASAPPAALAGVLALSATAASLRRSLSTATSASIAGVTVEVGGAPPRAAAAQSPSDRSEVGSPPCEDAGESAKVRELRARLAQRQGALAAAKAAAAARLDAMHAYMDGEQQRIRARHGARTRELEKAMERRARTCAVEDARRARERRHVFAEQQAARQTADRVRDTLEELNEVHDGLFDLWEAALRARRQSSGPGEPPMSAFVWQDAYQHGQQLTRALCEGVAYSHVLQVRRGALRLAEMEQRRTLQDLAAALHSLAYVEEERKGAVRVLVRVRPSMEEILRRTRAHRLLSAEQKQPPPPLQASVESAALAKVAASGTAAAEAAWRDTVDEVFTTAACTPAPYAVEVDERGGVVLLRDPTRPPRRFHVENLYSPSPSVTPPVLSVGGSGGGLRTTAGMPALVAEEEEQARLFEEQLAPVLRDVCERGRRLTVMAYGATGSGKTHTLLGFSLTHGLRAGRVGGGADGLAKGPRVPGVKASSLPDDGAAEGDASHPRSRGSGSASSDGDDSPVFQWCLSSSDDDRAFCEEGEAVSRERGSGNGNGRQMDSVAGTYHRGGGGGVVHVDASASHGDDRRNSHGAALRARRLPLFPSTLVQPGDGLLPRTLAWLCDGAGAPRARVFSISAFEVYNNRVYDLLADPIPYTQADNAPYKPRAGRGRSGHPLRAPGDGVESTGGLGSPTPFPTQRVEEATPRGARPGLHWDDGHSPKNAFGENPRCLVELEPFHEEVRWGSGGAGAIVDAGYWTVAAREVRVEGRDYEKAMRCVRCAVGRRRTRATARSPASSRSHLVFKIKARVEAAGGEGGAEPHVRDVQLIFCDLAGSGRDDGRSRNASPGLRRETAFIHRSLCAVADMMADLRSAEPPPSAVETAKATLLASRGRGGVREPSSLSPPMAIAMGGGGVDESAHTRLTLRPGPTALVAPREGKGEAGRVSPAPPPAAVHPLSAWAALVPRSGITLASTVGEPVCMDLAGEEAVGVGGLARSHPAVVPIATSARATPGARERVTVPWVDPTTAGTAGDAAVMASATAPAGEDEGRDSGGGGGRNAHVRTSTVRSITRRTAAGLAATAALRGDDAGWGSALVARTRAEGAVAGRGGRPGASVPSLRDKLTMLLQPALPGRGGGGGPATFLCVACVSPCGPGEVAPPCVLQPTYTRGVSRDGGDPARAHERHTQVDPMPTTATGADAQGRRPPSAAAMLQRMYARYELYGPLLAAEARATLEFASQGARPASSTTGVQRAG